MELISIFKEKNVKKSVCVVLMVLFFFSVSLAMAQQTVKKDEYKKVTRFGVAPLQKNGVHNEQELMELFTKQHEAIAVTFNRQDALVQFFLGQMFGVAIRYQEFPKGSRLLSMTYFWNEKVMDTGKWEWVGDKPFNAYVIAIDYEAKRYWIVVPESCGNICLWKIEAVEPEQPKIKQYPSRLPGPGTEIIQPEKPKPITEPVQKESNLNFFAGAGLGGFYSCFMEYGTVELGVRRCISNWVDVLASIGIGMPIGQNRQNWYAVPMVNLDLVGMLFEPVYLGAGIGFSGKMKEGQESQLEFGQDIGFRIKSVDLSFRGRIPFKGDPRGVRGNYKILLGIRIFF